jgi:aconitate hydratase
VSHKQNTFGARALLGDHVIYRLDQLSKTGVAPHLDRLPFSIRILLEALLRNEEGYLVTRDDVTRLAAWNAAAPDPSALPFMPARVLMQDMTGVPGVVDLAAMRDAVKRLGKDAKKINPLVPADLVIDHSVLVDYFGTAEALQKNAQLEFERNRERYEFLRWGSQAFQNLRVVPPATGICHQVNLEFLAQGVLIRRNELFFDTLVGTDSHTTMINGLGVLGWGVGGIEAEAVMLGQPLYMVTPHVVGFKLTGALREGVTATDLVLTVTQMLRKKGVVDKFVEFYGAGLSSMSLTDRATIANMAPDYGATMGFFPTDDETLGYLRRTGRGKSADWLERYAKEQSVFRTDATPDPIFSDTLELDLPAVEPSLAGPKKPEQRVALRDLKTRLRESLTAPVVKGGYGVDPQSLVTSRQSPITHGAVVLAAITSCTNTSNPSVTIGAGLLAKKAVEKGLTVKPHVKTCLAPGSKVVTEYLDKAGLTPYLQKLGFYLAGYGCTVCIGNSGPLPDPVSKAIDENNLVTAAVISGNRNFEGRVHQQVKANFLASPPLVVAFALTGTTDINLETEPLGMGKEGKPVFLRDIWPSQKEIADTLAASIHPAMFERVYANVFDGNPIWNAIPVSGGDAFAWDVQSTYIQNPPFFTDLRLEPEPLREILGARVLGLFGDGITTDHISPAGGIAKNSPAGKYLIERGVKPEDFNQYGTRRGNHEVLMRGTFANIRIKNLMLGGEEGGDTLYFGRQTADGRPQTAPGVQLPASSGQFQKMAIYDAAMKYKLEGVPLIVIAGKEYGTGSSRDWAAKGPALLGVKAVIAVSFERIHRSNLVGMGILPLQFRPGENAEMLSLTGHETFDISGISNDIKPRQELTVIATDAQGKRLGFQVIVRLDTPVDVDYYRNGGILPTVLRGLMKQ